MMRTDAGKSVYSQYGPDGAFTPKVLHGGASPTSSAINSPFYQGAQSPGGPMIGTPGGIAVGTSPYVQGYNGATPIGSSGYADFGRAYSPAGAGGGAGSQHAYSPTSLNNLQGLYSSPAYSPTTPNYVTNYGGSSAPIQQQSNVYGYGQVQNNAAGQIVPNISSPSQSPANRAQSPGTGTNNYGIGGAYGGVYPQSPSYTATIGGGMVRPGGVSPQGAAGASSMAAGAKAYDPAKAAGSHARDSDSSDSDK